MDKVALLVGGIMFVAEGIAKFYGVTFLGMNMPCGASLIIIGFGLAVFAYKEIKGRITAPSAR